jgi:multiple sugar transport system substrate-binding protein
MSEVHVTTMRITRRRLLAGLTLGAASAAIAACSGGSSPSDQTPAAASSGSSVTPSAATTPAANGASLKGTSLAFIGGSYFIPEAQSLFKKQVEQWGKDNGVSVSADFLNWPDLQAKIAAAVQSGAGADMFEMWPGWTYLYPDNLADVSDVAEAMGKAQDGYYDSWVTQAVKVDGKWLGLPVGATNNVMSYRISYFKKAGIDDPVKQFPDTWEDLFAVGKKLKAMGKPIGQALGHSLGDPPSFAYPYMWSYGAMEVEADGKTVAFNKPEFVDAMSRFVQAWKDAFDTTALAGDDGYNNRAFLADQISVTINGTSIYAAALKQNPDMAKDLNNATIPKGPSGRFYNQGSRAFSILKASKNVEGGKAFLQWWSDPKQFGDWLHIQDTYQIPPTKSWENDPMWKKDPKLAAVADDVKYGRPIGYAGPPNKKAALASSKYIVVDTFARAVQSGDAKSAINWGADQLKQIYGG